MNKKELKEEEKKFDKLIPTDKIRYVLKDMEMIQGIWRFENFLMGFAIILMFFLLPRLYSKYTESQLFSMGFITLIFISIISVVFAFLLTHQKHKEMKKFLNEKSRGKKK